MEINFDNLRITGIRTYNRLVKKLNEARYADGEGIDLLTSTIRNDMDELRTVLVVLSCLEGDEKDIKALNIPVEEFDPDEVEK